MPTPNPVYALVENYGNVVQQKLPGAIFTNKIAAKTAQATAASYYFLPLTTNTLPSTVEETTIKWTEHHFSIFADIDNIHGRSLYHYTLTGLQQGKPVRFHVYFNKAGNMVEVKQSKDSALAFIQLNKASQTQITEFAIQASTQFLHTTSTIRQDKITSLQTDFGRAETALAMLVQQSQSTSLTKFRKKELLSGLEEKAKQCKVPLQLLIAITESANHFIAQEKCINQVVEQTQAKLRAKDDQPTVVTSVSSHVRELPVVTSANPSHTIVDKTPKIDTTAARLDQIKLEIAKLEAINNIEKQPTHFKQLHDLYLEAIELTNSQDVNLQMQLFRKLNQLPKMATTIFHIHVSKKNVAQAQAFISYLGDLPFPALVKSIVTAVDNDDADMLTMLHEQTQFPVDYVLLANDITSGDEGLRFKERAAQGGKLQALTTLLKLGANPNAPVYGLYINFAGWLATEGYTDALPIACSFGADLNHIYSSCQAQQAVKAKLGTSGQHNTLVRTQLDILQQANSIFGSIDDGHSILSLAALRGQFTACVVLLALDANKTQKNKFGYSQISSVFNALDLHLPYLLVPLPSSFAEKYRQHKPLHSSPSVEETLGPYTLAESIKQLMAVVELLYQLVIAQPNECPDKAGAIFEIVSILVLLYAVHVDAPIFSAIQCDNLNTQTQRIRAQLYSATQNETTRLELEMIEPILANPFDVRASDTRMPTVTPEALTNHNSSASNANKLRPRTNTSVPVSLSNPGSKSNRIGAGSNRFSLFSRSTCATAAIATATVVSTLVTAALLKRS